MTRWNQTYALRAGLALCSLIFTSSRPEAAARTAIYVTKATCQADSLLSEEECQNAFSNAEAEFNDSAPVFEKQEECEKQFRRCVISFSELPLSSTALRFTPKMKGVQVIVNSGQVRTVRPILEGNHPAISFSDRTVLTPQDFRSSLKQQEAQMRWAAFQTQMVVPKLIEWCKRFCVALSGGNSLTSAITGSASTLLRPIIDAGAQAHYPHETHRFSSPGASVPRAQPRFVLFGETLNRASSGNSETDARLLLSHAPIAPRSP